MGFVLILLVFSAVLVLQGSFFSLLLPPDFQPDLLLVFVVSLGILLGEKRGSLIGFTAGLMQDAFFGPALGLFSLTKLMAAYIAGTVSKEIYKDQLAGPVILICVITVFHELLLFLIVHNFFYIPTFSYHLSSYLLIKTLGNVALIFIVYPLVFQVGKTTKLFPRDISL
ncbi:MAG TPA: rod shape-determining protein MreD [Firmicutes bacterium]|nr:rod shape-determining protein MreD [Bacillota bacterium]